MLSGEPWLVVYSQQVKQIHLQFLYTIAPSMGRLVLFEEEMENNPTWLGFRTLLTRVSDYWFGMTTPRLAGGSSPGTVGLSVRGKSRALLLNG